MEEYPVLKRAWEVRSVDDFPLRKIKARVESIPQGDPDSHAPKDILLLECGHSITVIHSQTKDKKRMRCRACGRPDESSHLHQESGPLRNRQPQRQRSRSHPIEFERGYFD